MWTADQDDALAYYRKVQPQSGWMDILDMDSWAMQVLTDKTAEDLAHRAARLQIEGGSPHTQGSSTSHDYRVLADLTQGGPREHSQPPSGHTPHQQDKLAQCTAVSGKKTSLVDAPPRGIRRTYSPSKWTGNLNEMQHVSAPFSLEQGLLAPNDTASIGDRSEQSFDSDPTAPFSVGSGSGSGEHVPPWLQRSVQRRTKNAQTALQTTTNNAHPRSRSRNRARSQASRTRSIDRMSRRNMELASIDGSVQSFSTTSTTSTVRRMTGRYDPAFPALKRSENTTGLYKGSRRMGKLAGIRVIMEAPPEEPAPLSSTFANTSQRFKEKEVFQNTGGSNGAVVGSISHSAANAFQKGVLRSAAERRDGIQMDRTKWLKQDVEYGGPIGVTYDKPSDFDDIQKDKQEVAPLMLTETLRFGFQDRKGEGVGMLDDAKLGDASAWNGRQMSVAKEAGVGLEYPDILPSSSYLQETQRFPTKVESMPCQYTEPANVTTSDLDDIIKQKELERYMSYDYVRKESEDRLYRHRNRWLEGNSLAILDPKIPTYSDFENLAEDTGTSSYRAQAPRMREPSTTIGPGRHKTIDMVHPENTRPSAAMVAPQPRFGTPHVSTPQAFNMRVIQDAERRKEWDRQYACHHNKSRERYTRDNWVSRSATFYDSAKVVGAEGTHFRRSDFNVDLKWANTALASRTARMLVHKTTADHVGPGSFEKEAGSMEHTQKGISTIPRSERFHNTTSAPSSRVQTRQELDAARQRARWEHSRMVEKKKFMERFAGEAGRDEWIWKSTKGHGGR